MTHALLFEREDVAEVEDWREQLPRLRRSSILWIDLERPDEKEIRSLDEQLDLSEESAKQLADRERRPRLRDHGTYIHATVCAVRNEQRRVLEPYREPAAAFGDIVRLDGGLFLAYLVEWVLAGYLEAFERIEQDLDEVD